MKETMGETIAELRKTKGMTQKDLAEQMNVTDKAPNEDLAKALDIALRAIPLAMGIAVVVGSWLGKLEPDQGMTMLGIGMFCLSLKGLKTE